MAHSKKNRRRVTRSTTFHEALPLALPSAQTLPHVADHLEETATAWTEAGGALLHRLRHIGWPIVRTRSRAAAKQALALSIHWSRRAGQASRWLGQQAAALGLSTTERLLLATRRGRVTLLLSTATARSYGPAIAWDLESGAQRGAKVLGGKRARLIYLSLIVMGGIGGLTGAALLASQTLSQYGNDLSSPAMLMTKKKTGTTILDRKGKVLFEGYGAQASRDVPLSDLPQSLKDATLAAEDPSFYDHPGFSWEGTARAAWVDITHGSTAEGGSTLTQQLVKNTLLTQDKNFTRKFKELLLSMKIEQRYTKDEILHMYLSGIYYGQGASGVQAAAQTYFHKDAHDLSLGEAALVAGLPLGPSRFDPNFDIEAATGRRDFVLSRMASLGKISKAQFEAAKAQPIALANAAAPSSASSMTIYARTINIKAPHFVFYVLAQLRQIYGDELVEQGAITVKTTLDLEKQEIGETAISKRIGELSAHHVTNAGLISLEPSTGDILAMVGSVNYNAPGFGNVNVTLSELQPGSSFKPIAYATAFKKGWNGATHIDDTPLSVPNADGTFYTPQNYDLQFHGSVSLRKALDNSLNIPAVKVLQFAGIHETIQTAHDMGVTSLQDESRFGLALVLGGGEVRPIDMATVYATFANSGTRVTPRAVLSVSDRLGKDITKPSISEPKAALDPRIAFMITHILSDDASRQPEFPANGPLKLSRPAAAKTGTTNDFRDNWTVGYTPQIATAVWVGNNDHSPMQNVDGITGAAPIWHDYMEGASASLPIQNFAVPSGITLASVCPDGSLASGFLTGITEAFLSDALPTNQCHAPAASPEPSSTPDPNKPTDAEVIIKNSEDFFNRARERLSKPITPPSIN